MKADFKEKVLQLNTMVMDIAIRGRSDCFGGINIFWRDIGKYFVAYIEDLENDEIYYRLFCVAEGLQYDRRCVMHPIYSEQEGSCIYDALEKASRRYVLFFAGNSWYEDFVGTVQSTCVCDS